MKEVWNSAIVENVRSRKRAVALEEPTGFVLGMVALSFSRSHQEAGRRQALNPTAPAAKASRVYRGCRVHPRMARAPGA